MVASLSWPRCGLKTSRTPVTESSQRFCSANQTESLPYVVAVGPGKFFLSGGWDRTRQVIDWIYTTHESCPLFLSQPLEVSHHEKKVLPSWILRILGIQYSSECVLIKTDRINRPPTGQPGAFFRSYPPWGGFPPQQLQRTPLQIAGLTWCGDDFSGQMGWIHHAWKLARVPPASICGKKVAFGGRRGPLDSHDPWP